jgi:hypothetical protein
MTQLVGVTFFACSDADCPTRPYAGAVDANQIVGQAVMTKVRPLVG